MIKTDFYPRDITEANTGNEVTAQIQTLNMSAFSAAYWLGWIKYENVPSIYHLSEFVIEDDAYVFTDVTTPKNYNVGYLSTYNEYLRSNNAILYPTDPVTVLGPSDYARYINKLDVMSTGIRNTYQIDFRVAMQGGTWRDMGYPIQTMAQMLGYLNGDNTVTITFQNHIYQTITKSFKLTDMTDGALEWEAGSIQYVVTILGFHIGTPVRDRDENGNYGQYISPTPCIDIETESHRFISAPAIGPFTRNNFQTSFRWSTDTWADTNYSAFFSGYTYYCSGLQGSIPKTLTTETNRYLICGNMLVFNDSPNYTFRITRIYTIDDIKKFIGLQIRIVSQNVSPYTTEVYGYIEDDGVNPIGVYAPYVTNQNEFTTDIITGSLSDTTFKDKLREWQYDQTKWDTNDYKESDLPPYNPEPGENDDAFSGEEFAPIVNYRIGTAAGFITLYALTDNQLAALGAALWSTPDQDVFWKSIAVMEQTDLSIDPAHVLDYIVSIRKYPLNLANLNIFNTGTPGVYLGRGISGISVGGNVGYLDSYSCDVYGGSEKVPTEFNDFRDYEPYTKVSMYVPFCGTVELTPSQVVGKDIVLQYVIDFSNGVIQANVIVSGEKGLVTLAVLSGKIGADVQATADNQIGQLQKISSIGHSIVSTGIKMQAASQAGNSAGTDAKTNAAYVSDQNSIMGSFLSSVMVHNLNSNEGFSSFSMLSPCIFVERKHFNVPPNYGHTHGYACNVTTALGDLEGKGFTVCGNVDLSGIPATQDELAALEALLQSGVYL